MNVKEKIIRIENELTENEFFRALIFIRMEDVNKFNLTNIKVYHKQELIIEPYIKTCEDTGEDILCIWFNEEYLKQYNIVRPYPLYDIEEGAHFNFYSDNRLDIIRKTRKYILDNSKNYLTENISNELDSLLYSLWEVKMLNGFNPEFIDYIKPLLKFHSCMAYKTPEEENAFENGCLWMYNNFFKKYE